MNGTSFTGRSRLRYSAAGPCATLAIVLLLAAAFPLAAQDALGVASGELRSASAAGLVFVNYEGPQAKIESAAEIVAIGTGLGQALPKVTAASAAAAAGKATVHRSGELSRYAVLRIIDPSTKDGLDADILILGADAQVDHVKNLRRIISGYLQAAWGYGAADAATIAVYVTVYNAVHRGDMAYIATRYKPLVQAELTAANAGLSLRYDEWPGKSRILIPLSRGAKAGALGAVDTGAVSDKTTTESLRAQPGAGIGDRQSMTELKDRETAQRAADLAKQQADIAKAEADLAAQKAAIADQKAKLEADKAVAATASTASTAPAAPAAAATAPGATAAAPPPALAAAGPAPAAAPAAGSPAAGPAPAAAGAGQVANVADREAAIKAQEADAAAKQDALDQKKAEADAAAKDLAAKQGEVAADRAGIAADQKAGIAADVAVAGAKAAGAPDGIYLYQLIDEANPFARIVLVDASTGKLLQASTLNSLRPQGLLDSGDFFVAVAGKSTGTGAVRLVSLSKGDLAQLAESTVDLFANTGLWKQGDSYYAVAKDGSGYRLVRFDAKLKEAARSPGPVNPWTSFAVGKDGLVIQAAGGGFQVLSPDKLQLVREFQP